MAAIAMRSSPIIPFRRDHQESPTHPPTLPPSSIPALPSLHSLFLIALSSCPLLHTHMQSGMNRAPPALSEQMGAAEDSRLVSLPTLCTHFFLSKALPFSPFLNLGQFETIANNLTSYTFVFANNGNFECGSADVPHSQRITELNEWGPKKTKQKKR